MRVGGGISYIAGPMGSGKSLRAVRGIVNALCNQQYVVTNVRLYENFDAIIAKHIARTASKEKKAKIARKLRGYYIYVDELQDAFSILTKTELPGRSESRGKFFWDEGHNDLNNRTWRGKSSDAAKRAKEAEERVGILEVATQFRKLGIEGYILSQHTDNTDVAIRRACNWVIRMQNQREQTRLLGVRVTPWPLFLALWYPANVPIKQGVSAVRTERYFLDWHRKIYDTMGLYHGVANLATDGRIALPSHGLTDEEKEYLLKKLKTPVGVSSLDESGEQVTSRERSSSAWSPASVGEGRSRTPTLRVPLPTSSPGGSP